MHWKSPPTTSDLGDPRSMLGNKLSTSHTHTLTLLVMRQQLSSALLSSSPFSPSCCFLPAACPGGLWVRWFFFFLGGVWTFFKVWPWEVSGEESFLVRSASVNSSSRGPATVPLSRDSSRTDPPAVCDYIQLKAFYSFVCPELRLPGSEVLENASWGRCSVCIVTWRQWTPPCFV